MVTLSDPATGFAFSVDPAKGGELCSVMAGGRELLHISETGWRGRAPWLFPAVGRSSDGMPIHGFVRDHPWELISSSPIVVRHQSDASTRALYPFDYQLTVTYKLIPGGLSAAAVVLAAPTNRGPMAFALGNHLTLALPHGDCAVATPAHKVLELTSGGMLSGGTRRASYVEGMSLKSEPALCDMVLGGFPPRQCWAELRDPQGLTIRVTQDPKAYFVFWSDAGKTFFCLEPWQGLPDSRPVVLAPGARFLWEMTLTV